jgi:plastocyanin
MAALVLCCASLEACEFDGTGGPCRCVEKMLAGAAPLDVWRSAAPPSVTSPLSSSTQAVHVFNFDYSTNPSGMPIMDAVITEGDTIQWQWDQGFHTVTSVSGSAEAFDSGGQGSGTFSHTFTHVGTFRYYCQFHGFDNGNGTAGGMSGSITVLALPEPSAIGCGAAGAMVLLRRRATLPAQRRRPQRV